MLSRCLSASKHTTRQSCRLRVVPKTPKTSRVPLCPRQTTCRAASVLKGALRLPGKRRLVWRAISAFGCIFASTRFVLGPSAECGLRIEDH